MLQACSLTTVSPPTHIQGKQAGEWAGIHVLWPGLDPVSEPGNGISSCSHGNTSIFLTLAGHRTCKQRTHTLQLIPTYSHPSTSSPPPGPRRRGALAGYCWRLFTGGHYAQKLCACTLRLLAEFANSGSSSTQEGRWLPSIANCTHTHTHTQPVIRPI